MPTELQDLANWLGDRLQMPVAFNDFDLNLLAASAQKVEVDAYRVDSILQRRTPHEVFVQLQERGIAHRTEPFIVEKDMLPGMMARMCLPIVSDGHPIGFVWIMLPDANQLTTTQYQWARETASAAKRIIQSGSQPGHGTFITHSRQIQNLVDADAVTAGYTVSALVHENVLDYASNVCITVFELESIGDPPDEAVLDLNGLIRDDERASLSRHSRVGLVDGSIIAVARMSSHREVLNELVRLLSERLNGTDYRLRGSGSSVTAEWRNGLRDAYLDALFTARLAGLLPEVPQHAFHQELGALALFRDVPWDASSVSLISKDAEALMAGGNDVNIQTLLTYLRLAGNVQRTCAELNIHRTTLYYRLDRCRDDIGDALDHGWRKTSLYLGLIMATLADQHTR